jgi:hypothetical protein
MDMETFNRREEDLATAERLLTLNVRVYLATKDFR